MVKPRRLLTAVLIVITAGAVFGTFWGSRILANPNVAFLYSENGADWILPQNQMGPHDLLGKQDYMAAFRIRFVVNETPERAILHYRAFRFAAVFIDGFLLVQTDWDFTLWKQPNEFDLTPYMTPGPHELVFSAINRTGPPAVLAHCDELGLKSGAGWEFRTHEHPDWAPVATTSTPQPNMVGSKLPLVRVAVRRSLPFFVSIFLVATLLAVGWARLPDRALGRWLRLRSASTACWGITALWAVLAINNITKVPFNAGFDAFHHLQYMLFLIRMGSIPVATDGWQMFQSPLYYLVSAPLLAMVRGVLHPVQTMEVLRIIPLICGVTHVFVAYRVMKELFPDREELQTMGTLVAGLLPINLYMSQTVGNEPLASLLTGIAILAMIRCAKQYGQPGTRMRFVMLGVLLGLAALTKITVLALGAPVGLLLAYISWTPRRRVWPALRDSVVSGLLMSVAMLAVVGWYFGYNWVKMGRPFVGGWDPGRGYAWWQEPGFRSAEQFVRFGAALHTPIFSSVHGFWDGVYSTLWLDGYASSMVDFDLVPLWNYDFALSLAWLSLLPTVLIAVGLAAIVLGQSKGYGPGLLFCVGCLAIYFLAMINLTLYIPSFSTIKASYTLGLLSCYGALAAAGFEQAARIPGARPLLWGGVITWAVTAYCAHFII